MMVRLIVDLEDPLTRETIESYRRAFRETGASAKLRFHHLPLRRHARGAAAALAALAARAQGKEVAYIDALTQQSDLSDAALVDAAKAGGLDLARFAEQRQSNAVRLQVQRERRALIALGVRATPSAIVNGRGLAGLPPRRALSAAIGAIWGDASDCLARSNRLACEAEGARKHAGTTSAAFVALVSGTALKGQTVAARPIGRLGQRFAVKLSRWDVRIGKPSSEVTATLFVDPTNARQRATFGRLLTLLNGQGDRVVAKILPSNHLEGDAAGLRASLALTAIAMRADRKAHQAIAAAIVSGKPWREVLPGLAAAVGLVGGALDTAVAAPETTVALNATMRLAQRVDARSGTLYINGRMWLGRADDDGLDQVLELARGEAWALRRKGVASKNVHATLIARGRVRSEAEVDLDDPEDLGDLAAIPSLGAEDSDVPAVDVYLFVDFRSLASRAAFHILHGLRASATHPVNLHLASMASSAEPAVTASGAAFVAAHRMRRGSAAAKRLFSLTDPNDWRHIRKMWKALALSRGDLQHNIVHPDCKRASDTVARLITVFEMDRDPVIYIAGRRYIGPIDEARIERAVQFAHKSSAATADAAQEKKP